VLASTSARVLRVRQGRRGSDGGGRRQWRGWTRARARARARGRRHRKKGIEPESRHSGLAGSSHSRKHTEIKGGVWGRGCPLYSLMIDNVEPGYLYAEYTNTSTHEVSEKEEKWERTWKPATGRAASYGGGKQCRNLQSCREGRDFEYEATRARNGTAVIEADV